MHVKGGRRKSFAVGDLIGFRQSTVETRDDMRDGIGKVRFSGMLGGGRCGGCFRLRHHHVAELAVMDECPLIENINSNF